MARGCTLQHILTILKLEGIDFQDQLELVKTISPNFDPIKTNGNSKQCSRQARVQPGSELIKKGNRYQACDGHELEAIEPN